MLYFNGFSLQNEDELFKQYLVEGDLCVAGFSYGAQKAFEYAYNSKERIDRLILLSPAFFQTEKPSFIRAQLHYFEADEEAYVKQFLKNVSYPSNVNLHKYLQTGTKDELEELLSYKWDSPKVKELTDRGTTIEIFLGENDKIINSQRASEFFEPLATLYFVKNVGHLLCSV